MRWRDSSVLCQASCDEGMQGALPLDWGLGLCPSAHSFPSPQATSRHRNFDSVLRGNKSETGKECESENIVGVFVEEGDIHHKNVGGTCVLLL